MKLFYIYSKTLVFVLIYHVYDSISTVRHLVTTGGIKTAFDWSPAFYGHFSLTRWVATQCKFYCYIIPLI